MQIDYDVTLKDPESGGIVHEMESGDSDSK